MGSRVDPGGGFNGVALVDYVVTGRVLNGPERYRYPWNIVELLPYGATVTLDLAPEDEALLLANNILVTQASTVAHLYPR